MNEKHLHPIWLRGDREGYIRYCMENLYTARGVHPTPGVAAKWFGAMNAVATTEGDIWIHKDGDSIWWTRSLAKASMVNARSGRSKRSGPPWTDMS